jgi:two-component system NtrC family sensor kinase
MSLIDIGMPTGVVLMHEQRGGKNVIRTYTAIKDTPWILVLEHQQYADKASWRKFKQQLLITFCVCAVIIVFSVYRIAGFVASSIRKSDELREALIAQTEHSDRLASIGRLAAGVAHEINNPLAIIGAKTQLMQDLLEHETTFAKRDKFMSQLESVNNAVNRSQKITHRLLGFARRMEVRKEPVQVNEVIGEVLSFLEKEALYQNIEIVQDLQADLPSITSDQGQLQQILLNITNNAIDAAGKNGNILITTRQNDNDAIQIAISDNGPGMTPEVRNKIFEPFFTTKTDVNKQGTGLGLSITYGIVKKLQGEIQVESEVGCGATFILTFPIKPLEKK